MIITHKEFIESESRFDTLYRIENVKANKSIDFVPSLSDIDRAVKTALLCFNWDIYLDKVFYLKFRDEFYLDYYDFEGREEQGDEEDITKLLKDSFLRCDERYFLLRPEPLKELSFLFLSTSNYHSLYMKIIQLLRTELL